MAQCRFTVTRGLRSWKSWMRGAIQNVPRPSVAASRTSPASSSSRPSERRTTSNEAASMRSAAMRTRSPSCVNRMPSTWRVISVTPRPRSRLSSLRRSALTERPSARLAARRLPWRAISRKMRVPSQSNVGACAGSRLARWLSAWLLGRAGVRGSTPGGTPVLEPVCTPDALRSATLLGCPSPTVVVFE